MYATWAKRLIPAPVAAGTVCLTMHLTNQHKTMLDSLHMLALEEKPKVEEQELVPKQVAQPKEAQKTGGDGSPGSGDPSQTDDIEQQDTPDQTPKEPEPSSPSVQNSSGQDTNAPQSPQAADSPSSVSATSDKDITEVIKELVQDIDKRQSFWIRDPKSLTSVHEMISRINGLNEALKTYKTSKATPTVTD